MKKVILVALAFAPSLVFAQISGGGASQPTLTNLDTLIKAIGRLINLALPIVVAIALLAFFWGLVQFIFNATDEDKRKEGKQLMIWGLVGLFVMVSVWGLVRFIGGALGVDAGGSVTPPTVNTPF